ncbi:MAG: HEAT repeat domain-containing protein [Desulfobacterales bacterium]|nr:HEAT repeat domain-containing protein [Desulfobacterales bacterium]
MNVDDIIKNTTNKLKKINVRQSMAKLSEIYRNRTEKATSFNIEFKIKLIEYMLINPEEQFDEELFKKRCKALAKTGSKAVEPLIARFRIQSYEMQKAITEILGDIGGIQAVNALLLETLRDSNESIRQKTVEALEKNGVQKPARVLIDLLKDKDESVRRKASETLGVLGIQEASEHLIETLKDKDGHVRSTAALALGEIGICEAGPMLTDALKDKDKRVRSSAALALGNIGASEAGPMLIDALKDKDERVRNSAALALGNIGMSEAGPMLIDALKDEDEHVRGSAALALAQLGNPGAVQQLINMLKDNDNRIRRNVCKALGKTGDFAAIDPLILALKDHDKQVCVNAAEALDKIGDTSAVEQVLALKHKYQPAYILKGTVLKDFFFEDIDIYEYADIVINNIINSNKLLQQNYPNMICRKCFLRAKIIELKKGKYTFTGCRHCHKSVYLVKNITRVIGQIGCGNEDFRTDEDRAYVSLWSETQKKARNADIDILEIGNPGGVSYEYAINAVLITLKNDVSRPPEYVKNIPVVIYGNPLIPEGARLILEHEFGEVREVREVRSEK